TYFIQNVATDRILGTYQWATANTIAGLVIALVGPLFGALADQGGNHKHWLAFFTFCCIVSTGFLWFACPSPLCVGSSLTLFIIATICLEIALIFYNSYLLILASRDYIGRISGWGWGMGYLGGIIALAIILYLSVLHQVSWLNSDTFEQIRIVGPFSALWFTIFSLPLFLFVPNTPPTRQPLGKTLWIGLSELGHTIKMLIQEKNILLFLISRMIYTDGLNTLFAFGGIFAAGTFHFSFTDILLFGISLNILAGCGSICLAWLDDWLGSKPTILLSLGLLSLFSLLLLETRTRLWFWLAAAALSLFIGPVQAASRTLMARLTPPTKSSELFGIYALTGRITSFMGPWILGVTTLHFHSQRAGMATILIFFLVGWLLLWGVRIANLKQRS
ncbi:MAG TPA: MFS transporter, partial [Gammaproteobacteria bacterium]|nr:MFS transporter [Gammaproteobacteria bacterium]